MKKIIFALVVLSLVSFTAFAQDNWNTLKSETGKFEVAITGKATEKTVENENSTTFKITFDANNIYYLIARGKHKNELESGLGQLLEVSLSTFSELVKGTVIYQNEVFVEKAKVLYA